MPTYDYRCFECGKKFARFQKMSDQPLRRCPKCKGKVKRLIGSGAGLIFKGKGFYATDYKKESPCPVAKKGTCPSSKSCPKAKE